MDVNGVFMGLGHQLELKKKNLKNIRSGETVLPVSLSNRCMLSSLLPSVSADITANR